MHGTRLARAWVVVGDGIVEVAERGIGGATQDERHRHE
jgi:hypothetical protein